MIKDQMDKKFGAPWHVVVGKAFSYEITTEVRALQAFPWWLTGRPLVSEESGNQISAEAEES